MRDQLVGYANLLEAVIRNPVRHRRDPPTCAEVNHLSQITGLLRMLTDDEARDLLEFTRFPDRLPELSFATGLSVEECKQVLRSAFHMLSEGLNSDVEREE